MLRNVLFLAFLGTSVVSVTVNLEDHCNQILNQVVEGTITIRLARDGYRNEKDCRTQLFLRPRDDAQLLLSFSEFQLNSVEDPEICLQHFLKIGGLAEEPKEHRVCSRPPLESLSRFVLSPEKREEKYLYYSRTVPLASNDSIVLTVSTVAHADGNGSCPRLAGRSNTVDDFRCESDNLCIPEFLRCDRISNCRDGSDERDCIGTTTTESTTTSTSTVASLSPNKEIARGDRRSGSSKTPHIIVGTVGGLVIIALVAVIALYLVRRNKRRYRTVTTTSVPDPAPKADSTGEEINTALRQPEDSTV